MNRVAIQTQGDGITISRHIYGHFSEHLGRCIYGGFWVGEESPIPNVRGIRKDVVDALKKIKIPNLRWPGGCFADEYHWKDGIGPRAGRPKMINTHWGGVTEDNAFGTHEFLDLCEQLSDPDGKRCEPYICGNVGSGSVHELSLWVEYINFDGVSPMADLRRKNGREKPGDVFFWGIGNENWGCGGNMTPEFYSDNYRRYATYVRTYGKPLYKIAGGANVDDYKWTRVLMQKCAHMMNGLSLHNYTIGGGDWSRKGQATQFDEGDWYVTMKKALMMDELVRKHGAIMDEYDPKRNVGMIVDEWGDWFDVEPGTNPGFLYQQNTLRDALVAGIHLNIFNNYAERVKMANIAQIINVLQSVILTEGRAMLLTPTYHVFDMYKVHHDALRLPVYIESEQKSVGFSAIPIVSASASLDRDDKIHVSLTNIDTANEQSVNIELRGVPVNSITGAIITSPNIQDHNTFDAPDKVTIAPFNDTIHSRGVITVRMPPKSVVTLEIA
jgi:alpha-L-arabinofuranosidase